MKGRAQPESPAVRLVLAVLVASSLTSFGCHREEGLEAELERVTPALVRSHLRFLSHDLLRGRDTGDVGYELAKEYVAAQFERIGLERYDGASYVQPFELLEATEDLGSALEIGQLDVREPDARFAPAWLEGEARWEGEGLFLGYGLATHGRDDYEGAEVRGKAVFLLAGEPPEWSEDRDRARAAAAKAEIATRKGATMVIELTLPPGGDEEAAPQSPWPRRQLALLHGPEQIADLPVPVAESPGAVRIGHPERSHLVEYLAPNSVFNSLPRQRSSPHLRPDDRLVTIDRVLHHASLGVA